MTSTISLSQEPKKYKIIMQGMLRTSRLMGDKITASSQPITNRYTIYIYIYIYIYDTIWHYICSELVLPWDQTENEKKTKEKRKLQIL